MPPCPVARSTSSRIRFLSSALNLRRCALAGTSGSGELVTKGTAILDSFTMILLAALLCNYGRGFCLIDIGTEGYSDIDDTVTEKDADDAITFMRHFVEHVYVLPARLAGP